jgi:hypothetical protein
MSLARRTAIVVGGRTVLVEHRSVLAKDDAAAPQLPPNAAFVAAQMRDVAHRIRRLAGPSRTRPHLFTEHKDELADELMTLAGYVKF